MRYKNKRPSLFVAPSGELVMPGAEFEASEADTKNPGFVIYEGAGYLECLEAHAPEKPKPAKTAKAKADPKAEKLAAVAKADEAELLKLAEGEADEDIKAAIEARAVALVQGS
jgi:hypothetical protein